MSDDHDCPRCGHCRYVRHKCIHCKCEHLGTYANPKYGDDKPDNPAEPTAEEQLIEKLAANNPKLFLVAVQFLMLIQEMYLMGVPKETVRDIVDDTYDLISVRVKEKAN